MSPGGLLKAQMGHISLIWSCRAAPPSPKFSQGYWRQRLQRGRERPPGASQAISYSSLRH